jgi:hypothetical protein
MVVTSRWTTASSSGDSTDEERAVESWLGRSGGTLALGVINRRQRGSRRSSLGLISQPCDRLQQRVDAAAGRACGIFIEQDPNDVQSVE